MRIRSGYPIVILNAPSPPRRTSPGLSSRSGDLSSSSILLGFDKYDALTFSATQPNCQDRSVESAKKGSNSAFFNRVPWIVGPRFLCKLDLLAF